MNQLTVYSKTVCPYCVQAKNFLKLKNIPFEEINIEQDTRARDLIKAKGHRTVPQIYYNGEIFVEGGWEGLSKLDPVEIRAKLGLNQDNLGTL
jgi:glutaredoxin 3